MEPMTDADFGKLQMELMRCLEQATRDGDGGLHFRRIAEESGVWETLNEFAALIRPPLFPQAAK